jgi:hypothetical protein
MPRTTPQTELDQLLALIAAQPVGLGIEAIAQALGDSLKRRTLQRRLATLVTQGQVQMQGEARAARYVPSPQVVTGNLSVQDAAGTVQAFAEVYVPTSPEGETRSKPTCANRVPCARQWATSWRFWSNTTPTTRPICR